MLLNIDIKYGELTLRHYRDNGQTKIIFPNVFNPYECLREIRRLLTGTNNNRAKPRQDLEEEVIKLINKLDAEES